jgi:hypothetical protein
MWYLKPDLEKEKRDENQTRILASKFAVEGSDSRRVWGPVGDIDIYPQLDPRENVLSPHGTGDASDIFYFSDFFPTFF